jgi:hypothetical protein
MDAPIVAPLVRWQPDNERRTSAGYPSDVSDDECDFVVPYLVLCREDAL